MKILQLTIIDPQGNEVRRVPFVENGTTYVLGDVTERQDKQKTSNSKGKTLLLQFVNFIFGASEHRTEKELIGYRLQAVVKDDHGVRKTVTKIIGQPTMVVDGKSLSLDDYKELFGIDRPTVRKFIRKEARKHIISDMPNPAEEDYCLTYKFIGLPKLADAFREFASCRKEADAKVNEAKTVLGFLSVGEQEVQREKKKNQLLIDSLQAKASKLSEDLKQLDTTEADENWASIRENAKEELSKLREKRGHFSRRLNKLESYLMEMGQATITAKDVEAIYQLAQFELPEHVHSRLEEVQEFYAGLMSERAAAISNEVQLLKQQIREVDDAIQEKTEQMKTAGIYLATSGTYQSVLPLIEECYRSLIAAKEKEGPYELAAKLIKDKNDLRDRVKTTYETIASLQEDIDATKTAVADYLSNLTKQLYSDEIQASFDLKLQALSSRLHYPVAFTFVLSGEKGEGVGNVKNAMVDLTFFERYTSEQILVHDSSCFNGVDTRQISGIIAAADAIAIKSNRQYIVALNAYQISDEELLKSIKAKAAVILSEHDQLLKKRFNS